MPNPAQVRHATGTTRRPAGNAGWISAQPAPVPPRGGSAGGQARLTRRARRARLTRGVVDHLDRLAPAARNSVSPIAPLLLRHLPVLRGTQSVKRSGNG
jgi:hypothetical protein